MMNITTPGEADFTTKQENETLENENNNSNTKPSSSSNTTTSMPWSRLKDPRIVRISRASGGKDRHSKVCTVKGLRDRRVRLSVPTAIQLYDLQDRLGLGQPSKVVDWLLEIAKHEINELPPLQMPPGNIFGQHHQSPVSNKEGANNIASWESNFWNSEATLRDKSKEVIETHRTEVDERENWNQRNKAEAEAEAEADVLPNKFFPRSNYQSSSSIPGLLNNVVPYNSFCRWDPSIFWLSHFTPQTDQDNIPSGSQVLVCPPTGTTQPYFPNSLEFDPKQINPFHMVSSTPLQLSMAPNFLTPQNSSGSRPNIGDEFPPKRRDTNIDRNRFN